MKIEPVSFDFAGKKIGGFLYLPEGSGPFPSIIFVHGFGGGTHELKNKFMCAELAKAGFLVFIFDFYDQPNGVSEIPIEQTTVSLQLKILKKAVDFISTHNQVDKDRIGLTGHSLGGMTVLLYAPIDPRVKTVVAQSPVSNFKQTVETRLGSLSEWKKQGYKIFDRSWGKMKINYSFVEDGWKYDVYNSAEKISCSVLVIHGDRDDMTIINQSRELVQHLKKTDSLRIISNADHTYSTKETLEEATKALVEFMKKILL